MLLDHTLSDAAATPRATPLVGILKQGSKLGTDSTTPRHWCFLIPQRTDGSTYLLSLGICTTWVSAGFVCLYICAGCLPSTVSLHFLVRFLVPQNPKGHSSLLTSVKACLPAHPMFLALVTPCYCLLSHLHQGGMVGGARAFHFVYLRESQVGTTSSVEAAAPASST